MADVLKAKTRMRRLLELVHRGEGGERVNAEKALKKLMEKHGLTLRDIMSEEKGLYKFRVDSEHERQLFLQIVIQVLDRDGIRGRDNPRNLAVEMTKGEFCVVAAQWEVYKDEWRKESGRTLRAFINCNGIFPATLSDDDRPKKVITPEMLKEEKRMFDRMDLMDRVQTEKMITGGGS